MARKEQITKEQILNDPNVPMKYKDKARGWINEAFLDGVEYALEQAEMKKTFKEEAERLKKEYDRFQEVLKYVRKNIDYPFECIKEYLDDSLDIHRGYFRVEKVSYGRDEQYRVDDEAYEDIIFDRQGDNDKNSFHCLVYQRTVWEDNYHGYMLFPLKDGRYWMVEYEC